MATTWIALLRGINVGKAKRLPMADLRGLLEGLGYDAPKTLLNSGNAVFEAKGTEAAIAKAVSAAIGSELGMDVKVMVRSSAALGEVVAAFPFAGRKVAANRILVAFSGLKVPTAPLRTLDRKALLPHELEVGDRVVYAVHPDGLTNSKLPNLERLFGVDLTARNWDVVRKLNDLAGARA